NEHVGIMDNGLRQSDALAVAFGELAEELVFDIRDRATAANIVDALAEGGSRQSFQLADELQILRSLHLPVDRRRLGEVPDALLDFQWPFEHVKTSHRRGSGRWG